MCSVIVKVCPSVTHVLWLTRVRPTGTGGVVVGELVVLVVCCAAAPDALTNTNAIAPSSAAILLTARDPTR